MVPKRVQILEVEAFHEPSLIQQRLVTGNLSLVTGDLQRSGPSVSQSPVTSYKLQVTSLIVLDQPQRVGSSKASEAGSVLRLVEDDTAALRYRTIRPRMFWRWMTP